VVRFHSQELNYPKMTDFYTEVFNEVVLADCYRMKQLPFNPDVIFDLGGNIGVFTKYAHECFPNAKIVTVEPDSENFERLFLLRHDEPLYNTNNIVLINKAIGGGGKLYRKADTDKGCLYSYIDDNGNIPDTHVENYSVNSITIPELYESVNNDINLEDKKVIWKIDIEGNENVIFKNKLAIDLLKKADYICMEVHYYCPHWTEEDKSKFHDFCDILGETHNVEYGYPNFYAMKK
jgi:FkbM family methyltransferase